MRASRLAVAADVGNAEPAPLTAEDLPVVVSGVGAAGA